MFSPVRAETSSDYEQRLLPVLLHCEQHLDERLTLRELAAIAGFAPHHFHRIFRHVTGEAPKEYLRRLRLERAVYRLKGSPDNVLRIALESGYATHETFTRAFVRQFDMSPSEFRSVLREYRECVDDAMGSVTFEGFTEHTPLTLRFDLRKDPVTVERTPARHLLFVRHHGYEDLVAPGRPFLSLWDGLFAYADANRIAYSPDVLVGIAHDDPYVTEERRIRFDACLQVGEPMTAQHPVDYRFMPAGLCVARRHCGGLEEIAKTFSYIGVEWLPSGDCGLSAAPPFEVYHCTRAADGRLERVCTDAYVPLEPALRTQEDRIDERLRVQ
ncbi:AraC family transcriptional regulator [Microbacterium sp. cf046]|uniref:AraC family transcriptional regulator n=1 Tax=Microbacterium sp. cf046 TaxID=1761803 RepID=UPI0008E1101C|nr:AraC family transcriptional regulator [Microbacterium sp. cf046]SFS14185.1 AraC family transcriptional regulator [Microbacterium sp. cf046]